MKIRIKDTEKFNEIQVIVGTGEILLSGSNGVYNVLKGDQEINKIVEWIKNSPDKPEYADILEIVEN